MKIVALVGALVISGAMAGVAGASVLMGPEGEFRSFLGRLEYDPSKGCSKPYRPITDSEYARSQYLSEAKSYVRCMEQASESDSKYADSVIAEGLDKSTDEFVAEVRRGY